MTAISNGEAGSSVRTKLNASLLKTDIIDVQAADVASAATTNIFAAIGETVHVTGSVTITAFDTVAAGITRWVKFTGSPLLTHSAALDLPGGANIQASPDDWAFCRSLGSGNSEIIAFLDSDSIGASLTDTILPATASGTNTYAATISPAPTAYVTGRKYAITFTNACTGASTLNLNSLGALAIKKNGGTALASGDIPALGIFIVQYDGTDFEIVGSIGGASGGTTNPASGFMAHKNGSGQNVNTATPTKVTFGTETYDLGTEFASSSWTIATTGYYSLGCAVRITSIATGTTSLRLHVYKNTVLYKTLKVITAISGLSDITLEGVLKDNFTAADVIEIYAEFPGYVSGNNTIDGTIANTWLSAVRDAAGGGDVIMTATQRLTNKSLTAPVIDGTPDAESEAGFDAVQKLATQYSMITGLGKIPKCIAWGDNNDAGTWSLTNSSTSDQFFTKFFTFAANAIFRYKRYRLVVTTQNVSGAGGTCTLGRHLTLGSTKIYTETVLPNLTDGQNGASIMVFIINGRDVPGASKPVSCVANRSTLGGSNIGVNVTSQPVNVATDGALDAILGGIFSATGSQDTFAVLDWYLMEEN